jgi:hypothetical protein
MITLQYLLVVATIFAIPTVALVEGDSHVQPGHHGLKEAVKEEPAVDTLFSETFSRQLVSVTAAHLRKTKGTDLLLKAGGGNLFSEGTQIQEITFGLMLKSTQKKREISLEGFGGTALINDKVVPTYGVRFLYISDRLFSESWIKRYEGQQPRTLGEPLFDFFPAIGKGVYAGFSSSFFSGTPKHGHDGHDPKHETSILYGVGFLKRGKTKRFEYDFGASVETNGKVYFGMFASVTKRKKGS